MASRDEESSDDLNWIHKLEIHRVEIIRCLDLDRQFMLSYLRSHRIFDDEDCQIILNAGPSRQQKVAKFLDNLLSRGKDAYKYFVEALEFEHAHLYEVMTGNPPLKDSNYGKANCSPVVSWILDDKQLRDFDREFLVKELTKQAEQYQRLLYMHDRTMKENLMLKKQLNELTENFQAKEATLEELKIELSQKKERENRKDNGIDLQAVSAYCQALVRSNGEKSEAIIALQAQLLARNENMERANKLIDEVKRKNENLMQQVRDLTINYDLERTESRKKTDQLRQVTCAKENLFKLKFELAKMTEDRDETQRKLEDFKNVAAALTARHDWLEREAKEEYSRRDKASERFHKLQDYIRDLEDELAGERSAKDSLVRKVKRLTDEINTYKEQREFFAMERENSLRERDQAINEREEANKLCRDMQRSRDEAVQKQIRTVTLYEEKYEQLVRQLDEREELKCASCWKASGVDGDVSDAASPSQSVRAIVDGMSEQLADVEMEDESVWQGIPPYSWTDRRLTEVINSIRRRVEKNVTVSAQDPRQSCGATPQPTCELVPWPFHRLVEPRSPITSFLEGPFSLDSADKVADSSFETTAPSDKKWKSRTSELKNIAKLSKDLDGVKSGNEKISSLQARPEEELETCLNPELCSDSEDVFSEERNCHRPLRRAVEAVLPVSRAATADLSLFSYRPVGRDRANDLDRSNSCLLVKQKAFAQRRRASEPNMNSALFAAKTSVEVTEF